MPTATNHPAPTTEDMSDGIYIAAKNQGIDQCVAASAKELRMIRIQDHEISAFPCRDGADGPTKRLGATRQGIGK